MLQELPVEIQRYCISFVGDKYTLNSLRYVNKASAALAAEVLFHTISVWPTESSAERYTNIAKDVRLNALVRRLVFRSGIYYPFIFREEIPRELKDTLGQLSSFQRAIGVQLTFGGTGSVSLASQVPDQKGNTEIETVAFRAKLLILFFEAVAKSKSIQSLTIKNLQDYTDRSVYEHQAFQMVRNRLKELHLQVAVTYGDELPKESLLPLAQHDFVKADLFTHWLGPMQSQLTHFTFYSNFGYWGMYPFCDLRSVFFPNLKSLALGNYTIAHDWQVSWILSHASSLESLLLDDCPMVIAVCMERRHYERNWEISEMTRYDGNPLRTVFTKYIDLRWTTVLDRFRNSLPKLRHFVMGRGDVHKMFDQRNDLGSEIFGSHYLIFDYLLSFSPWIMGEPGMEKGRFSGALTLEFPGVEEDKPALRELIRVVNERA
jgi:hypothetical protein